MSTNGNDLETVTEYIESSVDSHTYKTATHILVAAVKVIKEQGWDIYTMTLMDVAKGYIESLKEKGPAK